jgi:radical SAM superfamily enzyme YgiQ (UPF0313 family)
MIDYIEPVFRPPSEGRSLILQVTNGCSWNNCSFCEMYQAAQKQFNFKSLDDIELELKKVVSAGVAPRKVFLADGDAMTLSSRRLLDILLLVRKYLPSVQRISSYCLPRNLKNKTVEELAELAKYGLTLMYIGCESGDDLMLEKINKGETFDTSLDALTKIKLAGMKSSVMILNGLGGTTYSEQHAINSAKLMNAAQPEYLSTLVVSFPTGQQRFVEAFGEGFSPLSQNELFNEMNILLSTLELEKTIFRSDHASNYLVLKGTLNKDKERLLSQVDMAINDPNRIPLRQEWQRGL